MSMQRILHWPLLTALLVILAMPAPAREPDIDFEEILAGITEALELSDDQVPEVEKNLTTCLVNLDESQAKYENVEEPDPQEMISDLKEPLSLTDDQMAAMKPAMGKPLRGVIGTIFKYRDKRMGVRTKLKIATALKSIKAEQDAEMKKILSGEQLAAWDRLKEERKV